METADTKTARPVVFHGFYLILCCVLCYGAWFVRGRQMPVQALNQTADAQFKALTEKVDQLQGHVLSQADIEAAVKKQMGSAFSHAVNQQGGTITNFATATGQVNGSTSATSTLTPTNQTIQQDRNGLPPLTAVQLNFEGQQLKSTWLNKTETFSVAYGQWKTSANGKRAALTLSRTVEGQTEPVTLTNGDAYFSESDIARVTPPSKWELSLGSSYDINTGKPRLSGLLGKQLTPQSGIATGYVNNAFCVFYTHRFGQM